MERRTQSRSIYLAVLPLQVLADDPKVDMFCQGLVMDLITDLSRFRSFRIMAYETTKRLSPQEKPDSPQLDELHLDYLLSGMVRYGHENLLINLQLIHVRENRLVWAEKFSGRMEELLQLQEEMSGKIVVSLQRFVDEDLLSQIRRKPRTNLNAYECWLRGYQELKKGSLESDELAREYFRQALEIDPFFPRAYTGMSLSYFNEWSCQLWNRWEVSKNGAFEWAQKALELDEWDHVSNAILGRIYIFKEEFDKAEHFLRKSLQLNPNDAEILILIAYGFVYLGLPEEARELYERARRLNPVDNFLAHGCGAFVHFELGDMEESISLAERYEIGKGWVDFPAFQAAAYFRKGDLGKMQESWNTFLQEFSLKINGGQPADTRTALQWMINVNPYRRETQLKPFWEYMNQGKLEALVIENTGTPPLLPNRFSREGDLWSVSFDARTVQLPDLKGYHDLARLLAQPNRPIHCTDLMGAHTLEKGEAVFDEKAKAAYQRRILALQEELAEADATQHSDRLAALHEEYDQLIEHLARAVGKGGKTRKVAGTVEKCRTAVTWRIRSAIKKIADVHPTLGRHLDVSINTGIFCEYAPEQETNWIV